MPKIKDKAKPSAQSQASQSHDSVTVTSSLAANQKRLQSLKQRQKENLGQKSVIQQALASVVRVL